MFNNDAWLAQHSEEIIDPDRKIIDPHHHLWPKGHPLHYSPEDLMRDTSSGHNIVGTVFMECGASYLKEGPDHLKVLGETEFIVSSAQEIADAGGIPIVGFLGHADLRRDDLDSILDAHEEVSEGLFRGIRHAGACEPTDAPLAIPAAAEAGLYEDPNFIRGVQRLGQRGLTYDTWQYHHQVNAFRQLAEACPNTTMILDHFSTPLGIGFYEGKRDEIFEVWKDEVAAVAACPNVHAKIGGLAMPDNGYKWNERATPPSSDEVVEAHAKWYHHMIKCFGPERCMFESNFPVDRLSMSYAVYWNAMKKIAADYSDAEQDSMFFGTAKRVYKL